MERKEQICKAGQQYLNSMDDFQSYHTYPREAFIDGAKWADEHPNTENIETVLAYTYMGRSKIMKNNIKTGIWYIVDDVDRSISKIDILHVNYKTITEYCGYGEWETSRITKFDYKVYIPTGNRWSQTIMNAYLPGKLCKTLDEAKEYAISMCEYRKNELKEKLIKFDIEIEKIKSLEL